MKWTDDLEREAQETLEYGDYLCDIRREEGKGTRPGCSAKNIEIDAQLLIEVCAALAAFEGRLRERSMKGGFGITAAWVRSVRERCVALFSPAKEKDGCNRRVDRAGLERD
jgi:hypothetical protein